MADVFVRAYNWPKNVRFPVKIVFIKIFFFSSLNTCSIILKILNEEWMNEERAAENALRYASGYASRKEEHFWKCFEERAFRILRPFPIW